MSTESRPNLSERERFVLEAIIDDYISSGEPVGSRTITKRSDVSFSAATIRNVMSDLEGMGLLTQPHTSAGRIPTDQGFRFYVDTLVKLQGPTSVEQDKMQGTLRPSGGLVETMEESTKLLSDISHQTGIMLAPRKGAARIHHLDLVRLPDGKVLVIVVDQSGGVQNRIVEPEQGASIDQNGLTEACGYLNARYRGLTLEEARARILEEMREARADINSLMRAAMAVTDQALLAAERGPKDVFLAGETHALDKPDFADMDRMKALLKAFEERHTLVRLLDRIEAAASVQVFIGQENPYLQVTGTSVVAASYGTDEKPLGVIGVIGPVRMDYARVVPLVQFTAQAMSRFVKGL